ncbi:MAG TPA: ABC transporter substrate-binding protein [Candidatus Binatia bacterium]|nr:ABC transporter substrate-binding protein [Candidatus Binatia bacterium]
MAEDVIQIGLFNKDPAIIAADAKGFFNKESIRIQIDTVTDSPTLLRNLISGKYDLIMNNADNVIAWAEGQGEDPQKNDFVIFLGGSRGVNQKLIVGSGINDYGDLKGTIFAVDAPTTGYAIVGVYILKKHGLELSKDYTFKAFGNTTKRAEAMSRGEASAAMMSLADDEIQKRGFKVLAKAEDYVQHYARGLGATRRDWANKNENLLVRFTRAMIRATDWVTESNHKDEVIAMLMPENRNNKPRAEAMYEESISPRFGFSPRSQIDMDGIQSVLQLREIAGLMKPPLPKPEKYVDERFYKKALASLDR